MWLRHRRQSKRVNLRVIKKTISPVRESPRFIWYQTFEHRYIQCFTTFLRNWTIRHNPRRLNWDQNFENKIQKWMFFSNFSVYDVWISFYAFLFCYCLLLNGHTHSMCHFISIQTCQRFLSAFDVCIYFRFFTFDYFQHRALNFRRTCLIFTKPKWNATQSVARLTRTAENAQIICLSWAA